MFKNTMRQKDSESMLVNSKQPVYIKFYCSADNCDKEFNMIISSKTFANIRYGFERNFEQKVLACCPYCDHCQCLNIVDFLQTDINRFLAL